MEQVELLKIGDVVKSTRFKDRCFHDGSVKDSDEFVVESTHWGGGGTGHGPHDIYPDGLNVTARRLNEDGSYNPNGLVIQFYQRGCFNTTIEDAYLITVGRMKRTVYFIRE